MAEAEKDESMAAWIVGGVVVLAVLIFGGLALAAKKAGGTVKQEVEKLLPAKTETAEPEKVKQPSEATVTP